MGRTAAAGGLEPMPRTPKAAVIPIRRPLLRGERRVRIALVGLDGAGRTTLFRAVASTSVRQGTIAGTQQPYEECEVDVGLDQACIMSLPNARALQRARAADVIVQVIEATALARHLELTVELMQLGRPLVVALNKMDLARARGMHIGTSVLARRLGVAVVPIVAAMGYGLGDLFAAAVEAVKRRQQPVAVRPGSHFAALLAETAMRPGGVRERLDWRYWLDELFLSPRWGLAGSAAVFAAVLFVVFGVSAWFDSVTAARLVEAMADWNPQGIGGVVLRAIADGLVGLVAIVVPYMIPLVLLLIVLEQAGIMSRVAFAVDRGFHKLGLHGGVALPFLLGLGCNVPALTAISRGARGGERVIASVLVTFVPCSARSAIVLALAGKYLGVWGVFAVFGIAFLAIAVLGRVLRHRASDVAGQIQEIPPYALPQWRTVVLETWLRTRDVLTVVTPLLVGGSIVLALLNHVGADRLINLALTPVTQWWLGLPAVLGVPLLFGVLRKELSLLMIFQALGTLEVDRYLDSAQLLTFLVFLTLYVPCVSTFAMMLRTIGRRQALFSIGVSIAVALAVGGATRVGMEVAERVIG